MLLDDSVDLAVDSVTRIDTEAREVRLASGRALAYDYVVYAVGSTAAIPSSVRSAAEHAVSVAELESAQLLRGKLAELRRDAPVTVVGGGLTGIEIAAELAEQAGDPAAPSGRPLRMSCQVAAPLAVQAVDTVLSRLAGTGPKTLDVALVGSCVSLGRRAALRQFARKDDSPLNVCFGGRAGAAYKELTCRLGVSKIRREARKPGSLLWATGGPASGSTVRFGRRCR